MSLFATAQPLQRRDARGGANRRARGAVLLEVVLALVLFMAAATIMLGAVSASIDSIERMRFRMHAVDLAVSALSEIQLGIRPVDRGGLEPFEPPFEEWKCQVEVLPSETLDEKSGLHRVEVMVRYEPRNLTFRLQQIVPEVEPAPAPDTLGSESEAGPATSANEQ